MRPVHPISRDFFREHEIQRFYSKVGDPDERGCRLWMGSERDSGGYGCFSIYRELKTSRFLAHRVAYALTKGDPGQLIVRHSCDNPPCVNPDHLSLGTYQQNTMDAFERGRASMAGLMKGWGHPPRPERPCARCGVTLEPGIKIFCPGCLRIKKAEYQRAYQRRRSELERRSA